MSKKVIYFNDDEILKGGGNLESQSRTTVQQSESPNNCDNNQDFNLKKSKVVNTVLEKGLGPQDAVGVLSTSSAAADTPPPNLPAAGVLTPPTGLNNGLNDKPKRVVGVEKNLQSTTKNAAAEQDVGDPPGDPPLSNPPLTNPQLTNPPLTTGNAAAEQGEETAVAEQNEETAAAEQGEETATVLETVDENTSLVTSSSSSEEEEDNFFLRGGASESTQLNQLVEQLLATNMAKISNQLTSQSGGGLNITDVLSGINEQLSNLNTNIGKIIQLNNKNI